MLAWTAQIAMHLSLLTGAVPTYEQALQMAQKEGKPLIVFVGASWCPGCQTMKNERLPAIIKRGIFKRVVFTMVNTDRQPELTERLLTVNSIPQLILFVKGPKGWHRAQLIGVHDPEQVRQFLARETAAVGSTKHLARVNDSVTGTTTGQVAERK